MTILAGFAAQYIVIEQKMATIAARQEVTMQGVWTTVERINSGEVVSGVRDGMVDIQNRLGRIEAILMEENE